MKRQEFFESHFRRPTEWRIYLKLSRQRPSTSRIATAILWRGEKEGRRPGGGRREEGRERFDCSMRNRSRDRNCVTFTVCCCGRTDGPPPARPLNEMPRGTRYAAGASAAAFWGTILTPLSQAECHLLIMLTLSLKFSQKDACITNSTQLST